MTKVLETLLLLTLEEIVHLNPLQGGFRPGPSSKHTALILQEAVCSVRNQKLKAFVAFLDAQKAFDLVWHACRPVSQATPERDPWADLASHQPLHGTPHHPHPSYGKVDAPCGN